MRRDELVAGQSYAYGTSYSFRVKATVLSLEPLEMRGWNRNSPRGVLALVERRDGSTSEQVIAPRDIHHLWEVEERMRRDAAVSRAEGEALEARADAAAAALGGDRGGREHGAHVRLTIEAAEALVARLGLS